MPPTKRPSSARTAALLLSSTLATLLLAPALPAHAAPATRVARACNDKTDSRSADNKSKAVWRVCLDVGDGSPYGSLTMKCSAGTVLYSQHSCTVSGQYEIRNTAGVIRTGHFYGQSDGDGDVSLAQSFFFACQGNSRYAFFIEDATVSFPGEPTYQNVNLPVRGVGINGC
jgi:hypothetical protein